MFVKSFWKLKMDTVTSTFSSKTIEEVKSLLLKTRSDSEKKKEELRQMVGERWSYLFFVHATLTYIRSKTNYTKHSLN